MPAGDAAAIGLVLSAPAITDERDSEIPAIEWHTALSEFRVDNDDFVGQRFTLPASAERLGPSSGVRH